MSVRVRLLGVGLALFVPGLSLAVWSFVDGPSMQVPPSAMPSQVGPWSVAAEEHLEDRILRELGPSSYVARAYEAPARSPIGLYVGFYTGRLGHFKAPHDPEVCYPSAGWETVATRSIEVTVTEGEVLHARLLEAQLMAARQLVLYWFQPAARWPKGVLAEELLFLLDAVAGRPQYAYVRLVASVPDTASHAAVLGDLIAFASEVAWPVRGLVSGDPHPSAHAERFRRAQATAFGAACHRQPSRPSGCGGSENGSNSRYSTAGDRPVEASPASSGRGVCCVTSARSRRGRSKRKHVALTPQTPPSACRSPRKTVVSFIRCGKRSEGRAKPSPQGHEDV